MDCLDVASQDGCRGSRCSGKTQRFTTETLHDLTGGDFGEFIQDGLLTSALLCGALQARALLAGEKLQPAQVRSYLELAGISAGTALAVDAALNLL